MQVEDLQVEDRHEPVITESRVSNRDVESPPSDALRSVQLVKNYGRRRVVDDVSLHVNKGEVVGLLGANGAGKTTTFYMFGGTPTNIASMFLEEGAVEVVTGVNLPMVIKLATYTGQDSLNEVARKICDQGRQGIYLAGALLAPPGKGGAD